MVESVAMSFVNVNAERYSMLGEKVYLTDIQRVVKNACLNLQNIEPSYLKQIVNQKLIEWGEVHFIRSLEIYSADVIIRTLKHIRTIEQDELSVYGIALRSLEMICTKVILNIVKSSEKGKPQ